MSCAAPDGGAPIPSVGAGREAIIQGRLLREGSAVGNGYVRLLDAGGDFVAEVPSGPDGGFRFFAGDGRWRLRALAPQADPVEAEVEAAVGTIIEVDLHIAARVD